MHAAHESSMPDARAAWCVDEVESGNAFYLAALALSVGHNFIRLFDKIFHLRAFTASTSIDLDMQV